MKITSSIKKRILGAIILITIATISISIYMISEINYVLGGHTESVDSSQFKTLFGQLAITNVSVLSSDSESMLPNQTVLVNDNKITAIGDSIHIPNNYHIIDGTAKYLIPGLVDSHVHIKKSKNDLLLYLANGITHVGEMTGMKEHFQYLREIENGEQLGPQIYIASPKVSSQKDLGSTFRSIFEKRHQNYTSPEKARKAVKQYKSDGYRAIKLSSDLDKVTYLAVIDEAKKNNIPVIGHLPVYVTLEDFYKSGQSQLAHITSLTLATINEYGGIYSDNAEAFLIYFKDKADEIAIKLNNNNVTISSTIWLNERIPEQDFELKSFLKTIPLEYQNPGSIEGSMVSGGWLPGGNSYENPDNTDSESKRISEIFWATRIEAMHIMTRALVKHGVTITVGTDAYGACGVIAGFSLHDEMESLYKVGMSNSQILHSATLASAQWMNSDSGKIEVGNRADLVLLNKNPLIDIRNTKSIDAVIVNGKYLNRVTLNKMLTAVKSANNKSRKVNIDEYIN